MHDEQEERVRGSSGDSGAGTTDFALKGSETLRQVAEKVGLPMSFHTAPGAHFWFIWRQFLSEFSTIIFR
jgi:S-formylglutathione hydrolase FrmB